ncbi:MAG: hypothetical protein P1U36_00535 [Legionellaceae bacterium]|nr:hypothetical protein [Legionellaceae bacterium]
MKSLSITLPKKPAETICFIYGCYCVGSLLVSVGVSTITGAVHGLLVTAPANNAQQQQQQQPTTAPRSIVDMFEAAGIFMVKRSVRCVSGAVSGTYQGVHDSLGLIAAPWARLFQPLLGSDIKGQKRIEVSTQTESSLDSLSLSSKTTEHEAFSPIQSIHSESTLGLWSQVSTPDIDVVNFKSELELEPEQEDDIYTILAQHYKSF